ncbi:MAG TPA: hypothetical protein VKA31_08385 [Mariprofundaceae bacterium]|nr:hypothetical protein [Mariprofundaceae bacterium]
MNSEKYVQERIKEIQDQIFGLRQWAVEKGLDGIATQNLIEPYNKLIDNLYTHDMPFARARDGSDLVIRAIGPSMSERATRLISVDSLFNKTRKQIQKIAKAIAGISDVSRSFPKDVDLLLTGVSPGSFIFGLALPPVDQMQKQPLLYTGEDDPLYQAMKAAVSSLSILSLHVDGDIDDEGLKQALPDPGVRDALMIAAADMSPSGKGGVDGITFYSNEREYEKAKPLTPKTRKLFKQRIVSPVISSEAGEFIGIVREIDLDANRFEIRQVEGYGGIRCIFKSLSNEQARKMLGAPIKVSGNFDRDKNGAPRLMEVTRVAEVPRSIQETFLTNS